MEKSFLKEIHRIKVVGAKGRVLGELVDVRIDPDTFQIRGLVLKVRSSAVQDLGLSKPLWRHAQVVIPTVHAAAVSDVLVLNISLEEFAQELKGAVPEQETSAEELPKESTAASSGQVREG